MKLLACVTLLLLGLFCEASEVELKQQWNLFKELHNKSYDKLEEIERFQNFKDNLKKIEQHNRLYQNGESLYKMGINKFADLTTKEFTTLITKKQSITRSTVFTKPTPLPFRIPESVDWREQGAVPDVKEKGECDGSWIFPMADVIASQYFVHVDNSSLINVSTQELIDCAYNGNCHGGLIYDGYNYAVSPGLLAEDDYPSTDNGTCLRNESIPSAIKADAYGIITFISDDLLAQEIALKGPMAIVVDATNWQLYDGGILECEVPPVENHGAFLIGYGVEEENNYWLIQNSWGTNWGEEGYIRVARNSSANCGVNTEPSYVVFLT